MKPNYVNLQGWMYDIGCDDLRQIVAYAAIFGFSQDGESKFEGSLKYLSQICKCTKPTVITTLNALEQKGLIIKEQVLIHGVTFNRYSAVLQVVKNLYHPGKESLPNNNIDNNSSTIVEPTSISTPSLFEEEINTSSIPPLPPKKEKRFVKPTIQEIEAYIRERGSEVNAQRFYDFYESKGWMVGSNHMKDWKAAVRTWEAKEVTQRHVAYGNTINREAARLQAGANFIRAGIDAANAERNPFEGMQDIAGCR